MRQREQADREWQETQQRLLQGSQRVAWVGSLLGAARTVMG